MPDAERFWNVPNVLTISRIPLTVILCLFIQLRWWPAALVTFIVASLTDWIDGWWARKFNQMSAFGRVFDPLTDKILLGSAFIFLILVEPAAMQPWMAAVVIGRELLITGVRGYVESLGKKFGADWFGKLKTILQCVWLLAVLVYLTIREQAWARDLVGPVEMLHYGLLYAMIAATVLSGLQYCWKAYKLLSS
ncbi:MAG TPA: CDP-diacylglycerol--glycerol-3-phosphate 3-phosphatidyltransferase [Gemmataceae bacterium]|nr:CDP-diacylglycerol--glycerol-3-phosphate 3-phosphatidyltransferase [Gemmataceae bacterium]